MTNVDRFATLIIDSIESHCGDRIPAATYGVLHSDAVLEAAKNAIPFPMRLVFNTLPAARLDNVRKDIEETVSKFVERGIVSTNPETLSNVTDVPAMVTKIVKTAVSRGILDAIMSSVAEGQPPPHFTPRSRLKAARLAFFLGFIGAHKYYLHQRGGCALTIAVIGTCGLAALVTGIIGVVDAIPLLKMSDEDFAARFDGFNL